ncbi:nucleoside-triphosphatase [Halogranum amylolyticum]|uniref:Nucleoside-triphosphatase SAMN04487948_102474 n=1 Tax=Halogranum amylolyticum TaxID=660520 RepID=A0A1H8PSN0_9EURY|nr:NTPase [Halogranum amylolyticum]SEO45009.1 nucleoside-triphosphatase [Halogranum amylolyticum]
MPNNFLVTGQPRSGKTTVVQKTVELLRSNGLVVGGVFCPEVRLRGERVGFEIEDVLSGETRTLAHVDRDWGPSVGKYRVAVQEVDELCEQAFSRASTEADVLVVDEIAPMEVHSDVFVRRVEAALDDEKPLVAAIHERATDGFVGEVKRRDDVELFAVSAQTREALPGRIDALVGDCLE